jgi:hypothetical protein
VHDATPRTIQAFAGHQHRARAQHHVVALSPLRNGRTTVCDIVDLCNILEWYQVFISFDFEREERGKKEKEKDRGREKISDRPRGALATPPSPAGRRAVASIFCGRNQGMLSIPGISNDSFRLLMIAILERGVKK